MTVREWIDKQKKNVKIDEIISNLESLIEYSKESYEGSLDKEYTGCYTDENEDPWIQDILCCERAIELLNDLINHIENFEDDAVDEVFKTLGIIK